MLFMEPFWIMMDVAMHGGRDEDEKRFDPAYVQCLHCGGYVKKWDVRQRGGCFLCATSGEEIARIAREREEAKKRRRNPYKRKCPQCGTKVVTKQLRERGCYVCGWKPTDEEKED